MVSGQSVALLSGRNRHVAAADVHGHVYLFGSSDRGPVILDLQADLATWRDAGILSVTWARPLPTGRVTRARKLWRGLTGTQICVPPNLQGWLSHGGGNSVNHLAMMVSADRENRTSMAEVVRSLSSGIVLKVKSQPGGGCVRRQRLAELTLRWKAAVVGCFNTLPC